LPVDNLVADAVHGIIQKKKENIEHTPLA